MKTIKVFAIATGLLMVLMLTAPTFAVKGPLTQNLQYKFYGDQTALFNALLAGDIDIMAWPLTYAQYQTVITTTNVTVAPCLDLGDYEIAFNNNATDLSHTADRKAMNYTEFRQAIACLIDKDGLISGPSVNGFGTRDDTQIARPTLNNWVNFNVSKYDANGVPTNNYPWDYNETHALEILWTNGWYSHVTYPTLASLLAASLPLPMGSVKYPPGHSRAGTAIDNIVAYIRSDDLPRKKAGESLIAEMAKIGIGTTVDEGSSSVCYTPVFISHDYDFYTAGWSFGANPLHFYSMNTPVGIYPGGPNPYMIDDAAMTFHATMEYPNATDTSGAQSIAEAKNCQYIQVQQAMLIPLYSGASYMAYRTGLVGAINFRGYGLTAALEYMFLNAKVPPYSPPMTLKYGTLNPPVSINPIFSSWLWDYEVVDRIFNGPMATNPYKPMTPGKSPAGAVQPWMAYDWNFQQSNFVGGGGFGNPSDSYTGDANITFWFRHDITWQDGIPFTVTDLNYTIFIQTIYGDSWGHSDMAHVVNFVKDVTPQDPTGAYTCSVYLDIPTFWALYTVTYDIVPEHIYKYIAMPSDAQSGLSTTGLHGEWPGKDSLASEILPGAPFTFAQLTGAGGEKYVWIGTGMWQYSPGTYVTGVGGGLFMTPYPGFWMNITQGDIDFNYYWDAGSPPQGGSYKIGLSDLVLLANAYGTSGNGHAVPFKIGGPGVWEPGADLAAPASVVGLTDLVTLALNYGKTCGAINSTGFGHAYIVASPVVKGTTALTTSNVSITGQDNPGNPGARDVEDPSGIGIHGVDR